MYTILPRILCVDDEPKVLEAMARNLRRHFDVTLAGGGEEGLDRIEREGPFAVVVSDQRMPGVDGVSFLARVRTSSPRIIPGSSIRSSTSKVAGALATGVLRSIGAPDAGRRPGASRSRSWGSYHPARPRIVCTAAARDCPCVCSVSRSKATLSIRAPSGIERSRGPRPSELEPS